MTNTVCVLTNFRTGSTAFTLIKSEEYDLPYKGELFSHERPWGYGDVRARWEEMEFDRDGKSPPEGWPQGRDIHQLFYDELNKKSPICFKLMPGQVRKNENVTAKKVAEACDKVYLLYRRDWKSQALSWIGMRSDGRFGQNGLAHHRRSGDPRTRDFHFKMHVSTEPADNKMIREIKIDNPQWAPMLCNQLIEEYKDLQKLYEELDNVELICMEDYFSEQPYIKYNHEFVWLDGEPEVPDFDVEGLFR